MAGLDIEKLRRKLQESKENQQSNHKSQKSEITWYRIQDGRNVVRLLPPLPDEEFYVEVYVHYNMGKDGRKQVVCPEHMKGEACPVCEHIRQLEATKDEDNIKKAKKMRPKLKYYYRVLADGEVQVMSTGKMVFEGILGVIVDPDFGDITDSETGRELIITRSGKGIDTKYTVNARPAVNQLAMDYSGQYPDISVFGNPRSYEDIKHLMDKGEFPPFNPTNNHTDKDAPPVKQKEEYQAPPKKEVHLDVEDLPKEDPLPNFGEAEESVEDSIEAEIARILAQHGGA